MDGWTLSRSGFPRLLSCRSLSFLEQSQLTGHPTAQVDLIVALSSVVKLSSLSDPSQYVFTEHVFHRQVTSTRPSIVTLTHPQLLYHVLRSTTLLSPFCLGSSHGLTVFLLVLRVDHHNIVGSTILQLLIHSLHFFPFLQLSGYLSIRQASSIDCCC